MEKFKIFYSWQSDLPSNKTRNFIRKCIDEAIDLAEESEAIDAERDEATKGTTGSPNIVTTLFSKIDNCDLFIADVSLCYTEDMKKEKRSPNPNVLLELGYAVKTLGWERVICLCNKDYGEEYPFDIEHNRITTFSLADKSKKEVMSDITKIIFTNIRDIRKLKPRIKAGIANHIVGTYDFENRAVVEKLVPIEICKQESYVLHNNEIMEEAKQLFTEIQELTSKIDTFDINDKQNENPSFPNLCDLTKTDSIDILNKTFKTSETPVIWKDIESDSERIKRWLGEDVSKEFFHLGNLKRIIQPFNILTSAPEIKGTKEEIEKHNKLHQLSHKLMLLDVRTNYLNTFNEMCFIPIAIQNISSILDENIRIVVNVECGEIVQPDEHLIWQEYEGLQGLLCRDDDDEKDVGVICELFYLKEDGVIHIEDIPYNPARDLPKMPIITSNGLAQPKKTDEDYALELQEFIASTNSCDYYEFDIEDLRPGECKWMCCGMLIKPVDGIIKINYQIHSTHSLGNLNGVLEMQIR